MKWKSGNIVVAVVCAAVVVGCNTGKQQAGCPQILRQPADQLTKLGSAINLTVEVANGPCTYQWLLNGTAMAGQNNPALQIAKAEVKDAGFYTCEVSLGANKVTSRTADVEVYTTSIDPRGGMDPVTIYVHPQSGSGSLGQCPGSYVGCAVYTNGIWGWTPDTNDYTTFTAADGTTATNTKVTYSGWSGDANCDQTTVSIPNPPPSTNYEFRIYFPKKVPTTNYPIVLTGFYP